MAIASIQHTQPASNAGKVVPKAAPRPEGQPSGLKTGDRISLSSEIAENQRPYTRREWEGGSHKLPYLQGSASGNLLIYFNTRTNEPQLLPTIKGNIGLFDATPGGPRDSKQGVVSLGLAAAGNGLTEILTATLNQTLIDRDFDEDQHMRLDVEVGYSHIHDEESVYGNPGNTATYNAARLGVNWAPHPNINLLAGCDISSLTVSPYIGLGGRWQSKDR